MLGLERPRKAIESRKACLLLSKSAATTLDAIEVCVVPLLLTIKQSNFWCVTFDQAYVLARTLLDLRSVCLTCQISEGNFW